MIRIFAIDKITGERFEIDDLYWFEEEGVHDFGGEGLYRNYSFEFQICCPTLRLIQNLKA